MTSTLKESPILTKHRIDTEEQLDLLRLRVEDIDQLVRDNVDAISQIDKNCLLDDDTFDFYSKKGMCDYLDGANYLNSSIKGFTMTIGKICKATNITAVTKTVKLTNLCDKIETAKEDIITLENLLRNALNLPNVDEVIFEESECVIDPDEWAKIYN